MCRIRISAGKFETGKMSSAHCGPNELALGFTLACRTYPKSDLQFSPAQPSVQGKVEFRGEKS